MKKRSCLLLFAITTFLISCKKDVDVDPFECPDLASDTTAVKSLVAGQWKWIKDRFIGWNGVSYKTPGDVNYDDYMRIYGDNIEFSRTTGSMIKRTFKILQEKVITYWPDDNETVLATYDLNSGVRASDYRIAVCSDYLILYQTYKSDIAPDRVYRRLK